MLNLNVDLKEVSQTIDGFGGCFNELGWTSLAALSEADRESVLHELSYFHGRSALQLLPHAYRRKRLRY